MKTITQTCKECKEIFQAQLREVNRGNGKYCSLKCSRIGVAKTHLARTAEINKPNVECAHCHKMFYKKVSNRNKSKSGLYFCCREHKDISQRIGGIKEIQPPHYSLGKHCYRDIAFRNYQHQCAKCFYSKIPEILEVHHVDRNRENNSIENLIILCSRCHDEEHFLTKTGKWGQKETFTS